MVEAGKPSRYLWVLAGMVKSLLRGESRTAGPWLDSDKSFCAQHVQQVRRLFSWLASFALRRPLSTLNRQPTMADYNDQENG